MLLEEERREEVKTIEAMAFEFSLHCPSYECCAEESFIAGFKAAGETVGTLKKCLMEKDKLLEQIKYNVASCQAGDGDDQTWKEAALYAYELASKALALKF